MKSPSKHLACALLFACLSTGASTARSASDASDAELSYPTLFIAGGALPLCSDLAPSACRQSPPEGTESRSPARFRIHREALLEITGSLTTGGEGDAPIAAMASVLETLQARSRDQEFASSEIIDALFNACTNRSNPGDCGDSGRSPWSQLDDAQRARVLSALEIPQMGPEGRRRERAYPSLTREAHGVNVLKAFIDSAAARAAEGRPTIAIVTASAMDSMEPVDFYRSAFEALGADTVWWPVDAALGAAIDAGDCTRLIALRAERLGQLGRERVYPDLHALQQAACESPEQLSRIPETVHGVFFAGGDQWRLRQAFFSDEGRERPWLSALRSAQASGRLVVGGTSAGAAVQSGAAMLSNGSPASALASPGRAAAPPVPGCSRSGRCSAEEEDGLTFWPAGGLGLAADAIVDTHFSERAREPRLLRLLIQTSAHTGFGVDEASALRLETRADGLHVTALGREGGWVFVRDPDAEKGSLSALVFHLAPGTGLQLGAERAQLVDGTPLDCDGGAPVLEDPAVEPPEALASGAVRSRARELAACRPGASSLAAPGGALTLEPLPDTGVAKGTSETAIGPLRLRWIAH